MRETTAQGGAERPWLATYPNAAGPLGLPAPDALAAFRGTVSEAPDSILLSYFGRYFCARELDDLSDALACGLIEGGIRKGDRAAFLMQNVPEFVIALLAVWKAGGIVVPANPMYQERELETVLHDSGARIVIAEEQLASRVPATPGDGGERVLIRCSAGHYAKHGAADLPGRSDGSPADASPTLYALLERHSGRRPPPVELAGDDIALLTYTSGTSGPPKGAMNLHRNVVFSAATYRDWLRLDQSDIVLGIAPLFHITGLIAHVALCLVSGNRLVLGYRFEPGRFLDLIEKERPTFTIGAITALMSLAHEPSAGTRDLSSLKTIYSGGQPVSANSAHVIQQVFGTRLHIAYGMTETTSPSHLVPLGAAPPADPETGALSVGIPVFDTVARILGEDDQPLAPSQLGEIAIGGPQVVPGYWGAPPDGAAAFMPDGSIRTGDIGYRNDQGWFFVVDRKKDQINASGYKVWPREVEDVLTAHPAVAEAAVIGVPDSYRGETVKAFVSLTGDSSANGDELVAFCREHLAAYKCPRTVAVVDEIPKNAAGKILRRVLRKGSGRTP